MREAAIGSERPTRSGGVALRLGVPAVLLALATVGWWWSVRMASDMQGSGTGMARMGSMSGDDVMSLGAFLVAWLAMMSAMMFPAISPVVRLYGRAAAAGRVAPLPAFVAGYIAVWTALGLPGYLGWRALMEPIAEGRAWAGRLAGVVLVVAAVWQVTPLKSVCLRHCRSPMSFFLRFGRSATRPIGALRMGARHGLYCLGCCWALMADSTGFGRARINRILDAAGSSSAIHPSAVTDALANYQIRWTTILAGLLRDPPAEAEEWTYRGFENGGSRFPLEVMGQSPA